MNTIWILYVFYITCLRSISVRFTKLPLNIIRKSFGSSTLNVHLPLCKPCSKSNNLWNLSEIMYTIPFISSISESFNSLSLFLNIALWYKLKWFQYISGRLKFVFHQGFFVLLLNQKGDFSIYLKHRKITLCNAIFEVFRRLACSLHLTAGLARKTV